MIGNIIRKLLSMPDNEPFSVIGFVTTLVFLVFTLLFIFLKD